MVFKVEAEVLSKHSRKAFGMDPMFCAKLVMDSTQEQLKASELFMLGEFLQVLYW